MMAFWVLTFIVSVAAHMHGVHPQEDIYAFKMSKKNETERAAVHCFSSDFPDAKIQLSCPDAEAHLLRIIEVGYGKLGTSDPAFCKSDNPKTNIAAFAGHEIHHGVVTACAGKQACAANVPTVAAKTKLLPRQCGDLNGECYVAVRYACHATSVGGLVSLPVHELGSNPDQTYPHPSMFLMSPGYGEYSTVTPATCKVTFLPKNNAKEYWEGFELMMEYFDFYSTVKDYSRSCTYKVCWQNNWLGECVCPEKGVLAVYANTEDDPKDMFIKLDFQKQHDDGLGRLWLKIGVVKRENRNISAEGELHVACQHGPIVRHTTAAPTTIPITTTAKPTTTSHTTTAASTTTPTTVSSTTTTAATTTTASTIMTTTTAASTTTTDIPTTTTITTTTTFTPNTTRPTTTASSITTTTLPATTITTTTADSTTTTTYVPTTTTANITTTTANITTTTANITTTTTYVPTTTTSTTTAATSTNFSPHFRLSDNLTKLTFKRNATSEEPLTIVRRHWMYAWAGFGGVTFMISVIYAMDIRGQMWRFIVRH